MTHLVSFTKARIWGSTNSWSLAPGRGAGGEGRFCRVRLEIQGDQATGFHLVMTPSGFFTADTWHETKAEALEEARELFGVELNAWASGEQP